MRRTKRSHPKLVQLKERERAHLVECPYCFAKVGEWCISDGWSTAGRSRPPHADRIARSNGLRPTIRSGHYAHPKSDGIGMQWTDAERAAFAAAGLELPS